MDQLSTSRVQPTTSNRRCRQRVKEAVEEPKVPDFKSEEDIEEQHVREEERVMGPQDRSL